MSCATACLRGAAPADGASRPAIAALHHGPLVVAIHGILTNTTARSWVDRFDEWAWSKNPAVRVLKKEYWGGPIPALNVWLRNANLAKSLTAEILGFARMGASPIHIIAHSNGCDVALKVAHRLSGIGVRLGTMVLIGGACESCVLRSGIFALVSGGGVRRAVAYSSEEDEALASRLIWPYGRLGRTGWQIGDAGFSDGGILTRWFTPFRHGEYFSQENIGQTFWRAWDDCGLDAEVPL